ncbi:MAG: PAS domain-containing protein [Candidatus Zixiibacteriota bacterium]|nr:MAG: PAS domain-containing protein [candidate division Zixibacteria bacterium]
MADLLKALASEERMTVLRSHFDDLPMGFFVTNCDGYVEYLNDEAAKLIGFESTLEAIGYSLYNVENIINCGLMDAFNSILTGRTFRKEELHCTNRQGHFAILNLYCSPHRGENGEIAGIFGIIQDVTESSKKKAELEEAIYELSIMSQVSEALSSTADLDDVVRIILTGVTANEGLGFNRAFLFLAKENEGYLEGKIAVGPTSPEEAGRIWSRLAGQKITLREMLNDYSQHENDSNSSLTTLIAGWRIPLDSSGAFSEAINLGRGIHVFAGEHTHRETTDILTRLGTESMAVAPIISKGRKLGLIAADNNITGKKISDSVVELLQTFANQTAVAIERSRLYDVQVERARELEEINRQLAESQDQIIRVEKMSVIGELTSSIAHELRNPLTVIGGFANLLVSTGQIDDAAEYLNIILSETHRAETVLHQVLDFSKASRARTRELQFNDLVVETHGLLLSKLRRDQAPPVLQLADENPHIWGNPEQLRHALYQFMLLTVEELTSECTIKMATATENRQVRLIIGFKGREPARAKVVTTLKQIFGNPTGTQKLSILVAGETLKYHGGDYGVEGSQDNLPRLYLELPRYTGGEND